MAKGTGGAAKPRLTPREVGALAEAAAHRLAGETNDIDRDLLERALAKLRRHPAGVAPVPEPDGPGLDRLRSLEAEVDRLRMLQAEAVEVPPVRGLEDLEAAGFRPVAEGRSFHNPLRLHLVMAARDARGLWAGVPVMWAPMPVDCEALLALARRIGGRPHVAHRFVDPTRQNG